LKTTRLPGWAIPGWEPQRNKSDLALFDKAAPKSRRARLLDGELKDNVEERPEPKASYTLKPRRPRPYRSPTGEIVLRLRGRKGFTRIYEPWSPEGRVQRRRLRVPRVVEIARELASPCTAQAAPEEDGTCPCGFSVTACRVYRGRKATRSLRGYDGRRYRHILERGVEWIDYPRGWSAAEPGHGPYVLKEAADLALHGADVSGHNVPGAAEFAARAGLANSLARSDVQSIGPHLYDGEISGQTAEPEWLPPDARSTWTGKTARQIYRLELAERKRLGRERAWVPGMPMPVDRGRRAKTSEYRNESTGEYGSETKITPDGRVLFGKSKPWVDRPIVRPRGIRDGAKIQREVCPTKRGPKPIYGFTMNARIRKAKQRCKQRGIPFVLENYLKAKEPT
jgi:hypothetical protein